jgi:hypothetical protein
VETSGKREFVEECKDQWKTMWQNRLDDKVRAEGIADKDYSLLFVDRGTVIIATRKFKILDFYEILQQHKSFAGIEMIPPNPFVGGWRKFARTALNQKNPLRQRRDAPEKPNQRVDQQRKKGGRGWLHLRT